MKFLSLFVTNILGVLNDNFLKTLASFIAIKWVAPENASLVVSAAAGALVLPFLLFSPLAGRWAEHYRKEKIVRWAKLAETPIMMFAIVGFMNQSVIMVICSILLMGLQSALYSPAKYGLIRDIGGMDGISFGMGGMEAVSFLGMLTGMLLAAFLVDTTPLPILYAILIVIAVLGFFSSLTLKKTTVIVNHEDVNSINPFKFLQQTHIKTKEYAGLNTIIITLSVFWWLAASIQIGLLIYCQQTLGLTAWQTGVMLSMAAVGITIGCFLSGVVNKKIFGLGWTALLGWLIALAMFVIFFVPMSHTALGVLISVFAIISGFFKVPLDSEIQRLAKGSFLGVVLAYFNQVSFIFILIASATFAVLTLFLPPVYLFLMLGIVFLIVPFYLLFGVNSVLTYTGKLFLSLRYKVKITGLENFKDGVNYLIMPNHQAVVDPMIIYSQLYMHDIRPLSDEAYVRAPMIGNVLRSFGAIEVPDLTISREGVAAAGQLLERSLEALRGGENVMIYPSGRITLDGNEIIGNKQLAYKVCSALPENTEVLGIRINGLWGSRWSRYNRDSTPPLIPTLLKSIGLLLKNIITFRKRREVTVEIVPITPLIKEWRIEGKMAFNRHLEDFYKTFVKI